VVAWDVAEVESAEIGAELVQQACLKERYCRSRGFGSRQSHQQPLILHADNGNAILWRQPIALPASFFVWQQ
jgi:putative transposase